METETPDLLPLLAHDLLWPCWRGIPGDYKHKYMRNIWQQFEDNIRSAAYTSALPKFLDTLCRKLGIVVSAADLPALSGAMHTLDSRAALRALRDETTLLVLMVRLRNEDRKAEAQDENV